MALVKCSECGNDVSDKAAACPKCGAPVEKAHEVGEPKKVSSAPSSSTTIEDHRAAIAQAKLNEELSGAFWLQILLVAALLGFKQESWIVFGVAFVLLAILLMIPVLGKLAALAVAAGFAYVGYSFGNHEFGATAGYVIGGFLFMVSLGASLGGVDHLKDLSRAQAK